MSIRERIENAIASAINFFETKTDGIEEEISTEQVLETSGINASVAESDEQGKTAYMIDGELKIL